jgi:hypothetical protein
MPIDKINQQQLAAQYGFAQAFMNSDPELKSLFAQAVKNTWDTSMFVAKLRNTKWFKTHSATVRNSIMQETSDPATYKANVDQMFATVSDTWGKMFGTAGMDPKVLRTWAETAHRMGWSEAQLVDRMTAGVNYQKLLKDQTLGGTAAETEGQIDNLLGNYGLNLGGTWKAAQLEKIIEGNDTIGGVQDRVREMAMREYKAFADRIQAGESVREIADPYVQKMASLLERSDGEIGLNDRTIQSALKRTDAKGRPAALDLAAFADEVRKDKRWQYTDNAKQEVGNVTSTLLRSFGLMA